MTPTTDELDRLHAENAELYRRGILRHLPEVLDYAAARQPEIDKLTADLAAANARIAALEAVLDAMCTEASAQGSFEDEEGFQLIARASNLLASRGDGGSK